MNIEKNRPERFCLSIKFYTRIFIQFNFTNQHFLLRVAGRVEESYPWKANITSKSVRSMNAAWFLYHFLTTKDQFQMFITFLILFLYEKFYDLILGLIV